MQEPIIICRREFTPEILEHLNQLAAQEPAPSGNLLAKEACTLLAWYDPTGRPCLSSAKVALKKLKKRGLLLSPGPAGPTYVRKLRRSAQALPPVGPVPPRVDQIQDLHLYLLSGAEDPLHELWNDLMIDQHPCGAAPLVGRQLRYLVGSQHGWLGALGFGPAAFALNSRDQWIGWSTNARLGNMTQVVCLSRLLIRQEVRSTNLVSQVLSLACQRLGQDWKARYGIEPLLLESYVDRSKFAGTCFSASNWMRVGQSTGRGRRGPQEPVKAIRDIWLFPLHQNAREKLQIETPRPLTPRSLLTALGQADWCEQELRDLDLGDARRDQRAVSILQARWNQPQASFYGSFNSWAAAKGAYGLVEHKSPEISMQELLNPHLQCTQARMAAEPLVLLAQDTTTLNYTGLVQTKGLGPLGEDKGRGLWLHTLLSIRPDGVPLGVLQAHCWARENHPSADPRGPNAKSIEEKESFRWIQAFQSASSAARRMPQTQLVMMGDREADIYELQDAAAVAPANLKLLIRAQHNRNLESHQKLWAFMGSLPVGGVREIEVPRGREQPARKAWLQMRWSLVQIQAPQVGQKKSWPSLSLWALWVCEPHPPEGVEPIAWMLLTNIPIHSAQEAWEKVQWYCRRWTIEEWHRALKNGCQVEQREFENAEQIKRVLALEMIVAWRVLACVKLGRVLPQLPATVLYTPQELEVLLSAFKKKDSARQLRSLSLGEANALVARLGGYLGRKSDGPPGAESIGIGLRRLFDLHWGWVLKQRSMESVNQKCV